MLHWIGGPGINPTGKNLHTHIYIYIYIYTYYIHIYILFLFFLSVSLSLSLPLFSSPLPSFSIYLFVSSALSLHLSVNLLAQTCMASSTTSGSIVCFIFADALEACTHRNQLLFSHTRRLHLLGGGWRRQAQHTGVFNDHKKQVILVNLVFQGSPTPQGHVHNFHLFMFLSPVGMCFAGSLLFTRLQALLARCYLRHEVLNVALVEAPTATADRK